MSRKIAWDSEREVVVKRAGEVVASFSTKVSITPAAKKCAADVYGADEIVVMVVGHSTHQYGGSFRSHRALTVYSVGPCGWYCSKRTTRTT